MNILRVSSWSINIKIFFILFLGLIILNLINTPLSIQTFTDVNRQAFRQVVTESALRQKEAIEEDFAFALGIFEQFPDKTIPYLSVTQWLTRSDPSTENFEVEATQAKSAAEIAIEAQILSIAPTIYRQAWLIDANGQIIANPTSFIEPRFDVSVGEYIDVSDSPAHRAGQLLGQVTNEDRVVDLVVEEVDNRLSVQLVIAIKRSDTFVGTLVVELNNASIFVSNMQLSGVNNDTYSFIASPDNSNIPIALPTTSNELINLDTQATRSSAILQEAQSYRSGNRQVLGFYSQLFEDFSNDIVFVVELNEATALQDISLSILSTLGPTILLQTFLLLIVIYFINRYYVHPINVVTNTIRAINAGDFRSSFPINTSDDEIGELAETVIDLRQQLRSFTNDANERIEARARDLQITQEIGQVAISETDLNTLMNKVVDLITERFDTIYHAQIFLIEGDYAVLNASTGEAGQQLLAKGHRLGVGSLSVIGRVTQQNQTIISRDTTTSDVHQRNEFLKDTRAELAIPLRLGTRVIGALDVQSVQRDGFDDNLITILETLADQITIAIENSRLYEQVQQRLLEVEKATQQRTENNWQDYMRTQRTQAIITRAGAQAVYDFSILREQAVATKQISIGSATQRDTIPIAIPVVIRDQVLGVIEWEIPESEFSQNRILLAEELSARLAVSLDNARLVEAGRQTADNERIINTISAKISEQTDIEQILQTAIQEVGQVLRSPRVNIQLSSSKTNGHQSTSDNS